MKECCSVEKCDIFDFMADYVGISVLHPGGFEATKRLAKLCKIDENTEVIDIACGKGTTSVYLAKKYGCKVTGIDISEKLIEQAKSFAKKNGVSNLVNFHVGDAAKLPFPDEKFDVAVSQAMLVLVNDKEKAIREARRVIKPGGRAGWIELAWKEHPTKNFMEKVKNVICAYCMSNVSTFEGWEKIFRKSGAKNIEITKCSMEMGGMSQMLSDEGIRNFLRIMFKYATNSKIRKRMNDLNDFFQKHPQYFGYGVYVVKK